MSKKTKTILLTIGIVLLGFLREYLFANINWIFLTLTNGRMNAARDEFMFLIEWSPSEILTLKWILTIVFSGLFFLMTNIIVKIFFQNKQFNSIVIITYLGLFIIAGLLFVSSKAFGLYENLYGAIRNIMGMAQSFLPLMILVVLFKFFPERKKINRKDAADA